MGLKSPDDASQPSRAQGPPSLLADAIPSPRLFTTISRARARRCKMMAVVFRSRFSPDVKEDPAQREDRHPFSFESRLQVCERVRTSEFEPAEQ